MSIDALNELPRGGTWVKLKVKGDRLGGKLLAAEYRERRGMDGEVVLSRKTGKARRELVLTIQRAPEGPEDDGIRKVSLNESAQFALSAANPSGVWNEGGDIVIAVVEDAADAMSQATYKAKYTPPARAIDIDAGLNEPF